MDTNEGKIRVSFSGGGFRATFYSLGAFRRLVELGLWERVRRIDSVSGGSITAGAIMAALKNGKFKNVEDFDERVTKPLKNFGQCRFRERITLPVYISILFISAIYIYSMIRFNINIGVAIGAFPFLLFYIRPTKLLSDNYLSLFRSLFFKNKLMRELPAYPEWCANSTCLNTGKRFRFKQKDFGGNNIGVTKENDIKMSFAVACSAAFPPVFAPYELYLRGKKFYLNWHNEEEKIINTKVPEKVYLSDGGVYDNLGSENILHEEKEKCPFIIIDAGQYMPQWFPNYKTNALTNSMRIIETALDQIISLRRRILYEKTKKSGSEGTPGTILILGKPVINYIENSKYEDYGKLSDNICREMPPYDIYSKETDKMIADLRTDLDSFHDIEIDMLMWAGAIRADITAKRYLAEYLEKGKIKDVPLKPAYSIEIIKEVLTKGRKLSIVGFLHWNVKAK